MARHLLTIADSADITELFLAEGEFLLGIGFAYDSEIGGGAISNGGATSVTFYYNPLTYLEYSDPYAAYAMYTDSVASTTCSITMVATEGFIPFPLVGKVCGPMRVTLYLDAAVSGGSGYIEAFTNKG